MQLITNLRQAILTHRLENVGLADAKIKGDLSMDRGAADPRS